MAINVVSKRALDEFGARHPPAKSPLATWRAVVSKAAWTCFNDVRATYNKTDLVDGLLVFNINSYRIIASMDYLGRRLYIKHVFTHAEYDKWTEENR